MMPDMYVWHGSKLLISVSWRFRLLADFIDLVGGTDAGFADIVSDIGDAACNAHGWRGGSSR